MASVFDPLRDNPEFMVNFPKDRPMPNPSFLEKLRTGTQETFVPSEGELRNPDTRWKEILMGILGTAGMVGAMSNPALAPLAILLSGVAGERVSGRRGLEAETRGEAMRGRERQSVFGQDIAKMGVAHGQTLEQQQPLIAAGLVEQTIRDKSAKEIAGMN